MDAHLFIGLVGSVASIVSLVIAAPNMRSRLLHFLYAILLTAVVGFGVKALANANRERDNLQTRLSHIRAIEIEAKALLSTRSYVSTSDVGENRGFILAGLAFLEKHRDEFPEVYGIAKQLAVDGVKVTQSAGSVGTPDYYNEEKRMNDGAQTMRALLLGIAGGQNR